MFALVHLLTRLSALSAYRFPALDDVDVRGRPRQRRGCPLKQPDAPLGVDVASSALVSPAVGVDAGAGGGDRIRRSAEAVQATDQGARLGRGR
ncbi:hypothetical protein [Kineococcus sp. SYSU DK005]|uniref:hypothetical protein n=1 Tax=Kineococcus sp. SYSU DK005 TaxID=3383126 RepID=UPI003D7CC3FE